MRIAFITGSLEPGQDGVGDYTRRLAAEFIRQGHPATIIALHDMRVSQIILESQEADGIRVPVLRLPYLLPWVKRTTEARNRLEIFKPDWASLQFVPFGFHPKGLCFGLGKRLAMINPNAAWHVMFHELWLGLGANSSTKHKIWGALQRKIVSRLMQYLQPRTIHTQAEPYQRVLGEDGMKVSILPLFGNIPYAGKTDADVILEQLIPRVDGKQLDRTSLYLTGVLGAVHPEWEAERAVEMLLPMVQCSQKRLVLVFLGRNNLSPETFIQLKSKLQDRAEVVVMGERPSCEISQILQSLDLGLATSPWQNIQKSGSVAAMLEHGLQVLVTRDDWRLRSPNFSLEEVSPRLLTPAQFALLKTLPVRDLHSSGEDSVKRIADKLLASMDSTMVADAILHA